MSFSWALSVMSFAVSLYPLFVSHFAETDTGLGLSHPTQPPPPGSARKPERLNRTPDRHVHQHRTRPRGELLQQSIGILQRVLSPHTKVGARSLSSSNIRNTVIWLPFSPTFVIVILVCCLQCVFVGSTCCSCRFHTSGTNNGWID